MALLIGITIGTYSSVFTATPLLTLLDRPPARRITHRSGSGSGARGRSRRSGRRPAAARG